MFNGAGGVVEGRVGGEGGSVAFTVSVNGSGIVTLDQIRAVSHPDASNPDDPVSPNATSIQLTATITDADGDPASLQVNIGGSLVFEDDGPSISPGAAEPTLVVDESDLTVDRTLSFTDAFAAAFGADGPAGSGSLSYSLGINAGATGLVDTATGLPVVLSVEGGMVVGRAGPGGEIVFTVGVNATGDVTLDQQRAVIHPDATNPDDAISLATDDLITITGTATDADGDTASVTIGIGRNLVLEDDGPSINPAVNAQATVTVDESLPSSAPAINTGAIAKGNDPDLSDATGTALGQGNSGSAIVTANAAFGADGPAASDSLSYALSILNVNAGLTLTDGTAINLQNVGGVIVGVVASGAFAGQAAFAIAINSSTGIVTVEQYLSLHHDVNPDPNDPLSFGSNVIGATVTATDRDGDSVTSAAVDIGGQLTFRDDGPSANNDTDTTDPITDQAVGNVITGSGTNEGTGNADVPGADGFGSITNLVGFGGSADNNPLGGFTVNGQFGSLQMDANGNYTYTRTGGLGGGQNETFTYTYVDGDGDPATATLIITIADEAPIAGNVNVLLDDDALANGNPGGTGDDVDAQNVAGNLPGSGGDGALTFDLLLTGAPAGFTYVNGPAGSVLVQQGGVTVLTITLNAATGAYTVVQNAPIQHAAGNNENNVSFTINYTVSDVDNDTANGTININVDDDTPIAAATLLTGTVDEDGVLEGAANAGPGDGIAGGIGDVAGTATVASGNVSTLFASGADTPLTYALLANTAGLPALTSGGVAVTYSVVGNTLTASAGGNTVFTFVLNGTTGAYDFTLVDQLDHAAGANENDLTIALGSIIQATDHDGNSVTANANGLVITVDDDTPIATATLLTGTVDEDGVLEGAADAGPGDGIAGGVGDVAGEATVATGSVAALFQSGADEPLTYSLLANTAGLPALTSAGVAVTYAVVGNTLTASAGAETVFTFVLNANGSYTFTLVDQLDHAPGANENDLSIALGSIIQATDFDGDSVTANANGLVITVDDDTPVANNDVNSIVGGNGPATGNVLTGIDSGGGDANVTDGVADLVGADAPAAITAAASVNVPANADTDPSANFVIAGQFGVLTLNANGTYSYLRTDGSPGNKVDVFSYTLTDADGDSVTATLTININDSAPTAGNVNVLLDDDALANGNPGGTGDDVDAQNVAGNLPGSGGNGALTFDLLLTGAPVGFTYIDGPAGSVLVQQGGVTVLTITLNAATGAYTVVQNAPIIHAAGGNENNQPFTINYVVSDADSDTANGTISINVDDDTPIVAATLLTGTVDEDGVLEGAANAGPGDGIAGGIGDVAGTATVASGNVSTLFASGADTPLTYALLANTAGLPALTSGGVAVTYSVVGNTLTASAGGNTVFTFVLNGTTGAYDFTLVDQLDHAAGANENDLTIALGSIIQATDHDGDSVTANANGLVITVDDDTPIATATLLTGTVDEDGVLEGAADAGPGDGIAGGVGDVAGEATVATGSVATLFQSGADEPLTYSLLANTAGLPALTSAGVAVTYAVVGNTLTASAGAETVFTFVLNANGSYTFTLVDQLDHAPGANENDLSIALGSIIQATDFDGDSVTANANGLVITVDDDTPTLGTIQNQTANNNPASGVSTGTLHFETGADAPAAVTAITANNTGVTSGGFNLVTNFSGNALTAYQDVNGNGVYNAGVDTVAVYTLTVNPAAGTSGQYVFDLITPLDPTVTETAIGGSSSFGAGPETQGQVLENVAGTQDLAVVSGYHMGGTFNEATWLSTGSAGPATNFITAGVNGSTAGWGIDNNNFNGTDEMFVWDFGSGALRDPDGAGGYVPAVGVVLPADQCRYVRPHRLQQRRRRHQLRRSLH